MASCRCDGVEKLRSWGECGERVGVPTGVKSFPYDLVSAPRRFAERFFAVRHWSELPRGGHVGALEEPELFAGDLRGFAASIG